MGATVSGPSITVDETAETITLTAGATIPTRFLRVFGCETMTVTAEAEVTRKIKALDVVLAIDLSASMRSGVAGDGGTGETSGLVTAPTVYRTRPPGGALQYGNHWFSVHLTRFSTEVDFSSSDVRSTSHSGPISAMQLTSANDAVDGSHPTASQCANVWLVQPLGRRAAHE